LPVQSGPGAGPEPVTGYSGRMIVLFTDFGLEGPYTGQVKAVLARDAPGAVVVDLFADLPPCNAKAAAYLLPAFAREFAAGDVFLCVIDPGVGGARMPVVVEADGRFFVGPGNGLFEMIRRRAKTPRLFEITWKPARLSASFHGRDLFAPVAARIARGDAVPGEIRAPDAGPAADWPDDLAEIVYVDRFGNCMTGLRAASVAPDAGLEAGGRAVPRQRTFSDVADGAVLCYENANGLIEIAANGSRADRALGLSVGSPVRVLHARG